MEMRLFFGFKEIPEGSFINYQRGVLNDYLEKENSVVLRYRDQLLLIKDPLLVDSGTTVNPVYYKNQNIIDVMLDIVKKYAPQRLIDTTSFTNIKSAFFSTMTVTRPITETIKDAKTLLDELQLLTGCPVIQKEDGKLYLVNLFDETTAVSATFDDDVSDEIGKCQFSFDRRINVCTVRRAYWDLGLKAEAKDKYYESSVNAASILDTGKNQEYIIENKWLPFDAMSDGKQANQVIADRLTSFFGYGVWILKRKTSDAFAYLQVGDFVNVTTNQILYKGISLPTTKRGVIIKREPSPTDGTINFTIFLLKPLLPILPSNAPTGISFSALSSSGMTVNWTKGAGADGTIVLMNTGAYPTSLPQDGYPYAEGDTMPDGSKVKYIGTGSSKAVTGLLSSTEYFVRLYSYNTVGTNYRFKTDATLQGSKYTDSIEPTTQPTNLRLTVVDATSIKVDWDAAAAPGAQQYIVVYKASPDAVNNPVDGNGYTAGAAVGTGVCGYSGTELSATLTGLTGGVTYYIRVYSFNGMVDAQKNYYTTSPLSGNKTCTVAEPTAQISTFSLNVVYIPKRTCLLGWSEESPKATGVIILAKAGAISDSPTDTNIYHVGDTIGSSAVVFVGDSVAEGFSIQSNTYDNFKAFTYNGTSSPNYYLTGAPVAT
jgi:hypothetical protein